MRTVMSSSGAAGRAGRPGRRHDVAFAVTISVLLTAYNNLAGLHSWHRRWYAPLNLGATGVVLGAAAASGLRAPELGLAREALPRGLRSAAPAAAAVTAGYLFAAAVPPARAVLRDERLSTQSGRAAACHALIRVPAGTVLWEETAFRGVLQAALGRVLPQRTSIVVTSALFGIWHIRPALEAVRANRPGASARATVAAVTASAVATTAAGALLSWLRARSGSLAAPVLLHLAANAPGPVAAWAVARRGGSGRG